MEGLRRRFIGLNLPVAGIPSWVFHGIGLCSPGFAPRLSRQPRAEREKKKRPLGEWKGSEDTRFAASRESLKMPGYIHAAARYLGTSEKVREET